MIKNLQLDFQITFDDEIDLSKFDNNLNEL